MKIIRPLNMVNAALTSSSVTEADYTAYSTATVYNTADRVIFVSPAATATITIANPAIVTQAAHGFINGTQIVFTSSGNLPTGITSGSSYYIVNRTTNTYQLSLTLSGNPIITSGSQSGVHTATAQLHEVYESLIGSQSTVTMTIATPCVVTWTAHGLIAGTPISFTTTGALPTGLVVGTVYYVLAPITNSFNVSATSGGAAINTTGTQSGVHTTTAGSNYNTVPPISTTQWVKVGATNRWKCFDQSVSSQSSNTSTIVNVFAATGRVDSVALINVNAASATITQTDPIEGVVYNHTYSLVADSGVQDWYAYLFEPVVRITDQVHTDLFPYANSSISVTLTDTGNTVLCGGMILGLSKDISYLTTTGSHVGTELGMKLSIQDYSVKQQDAYGNYTILQRSFSKRANFTAFVESTYVDALSNLLASYRSTPVVVVGSADYGASILYGFYKDYSIDVSYHTKSVCSIEWEGLT